MSQPLELTFNFPTAGIVLDLNQYFDTSSTNITGYQVNWGDGNSDTTFVHTYNAAGPYKISISATTLLHFGLNIVSPNTTIQYLTAVNSWGTLPIENFYKAFYGATALVSVPNTLPDSARNLVSMFLSCTALNNPNISSWDVSEVISFTGMFFNCTNFNQPLNNWNIGQGLNMANMFEYTSMSAINYSATLVGWADQIPNVQYGVNFTMYGLTYNPAGAAARSLLAASPYNWIFDGDLAETPAPMELTFNFPANTTLELNQYFDTSPANITGYQVNWGDGNSDTTFVHTYNAAGPYTISIWATTLVLFGSSYGAFNVTIRYLTAINSWGTIPIQDFNYAFHKATALVSVPTTLPDSARNLAYMFFKCSLLNDSNISNWNVSQVTRFDTMFFDCAEFNQPLNNWNIGQGINMANMFDNTNMSTANYSATLVGWAAQKPNVQANVIVGATGLTYNQAGADARSLLAAGPSLWAFTNDAPAPVPMILEYTSNDPFTLTLPLDFDFFGPDNIAPNLTIDWGDGFVDTNISTSLPSHTFAAAGTYEVKIYADYVRVYGVFNSLQGREFLTQVVQWGELQTVAFIAAFQGATNLSGVPAALPTDINGSPQIVSTFGLFVNCTSFNQNINGWDVESVSSFVNYGDSYSMEFMFFGCTNFNRPLNDWKVGNVLSMYGMFDTCTIFNQPLNEWDVKNVTNMSFMFYGCTSFNQPLNNWDVGKVIYMYGMFTLSGLRPTNYSNMLLTWATLPVLESGVTLSVGPAYNALAVSARSFLTGSKGWTIEDGGLNEALPMILVYDTPTANYEIELPFDYHNCAPNLTINWGDGNVTISKVHTFVEKGIYTIYIYADYINVINRSFVLPNLALTQVLQFGMLKTRIFGFAFVNAVNLTVVPEYLPTDIDGTPQVINMFGMFAECTKFNQPLDKWNVSKVQIMQAMFFNCKKFNQSLGSWNIASLSNAFMMFGEVFDDNACGISPTNYSNTLRGWAALPLLQTVQTGYGQPAYNSLAVSARSTLTDIWGWSIEDGGLNEALPMILKYTSSGPFTLTLPLDFDFFGPDIIAANLTIDWDDGFVDTNISISLPTHTFAAAGTYEVKIYADYVRVYGVFNLLQGREYLTQVVQWGELQTVAFIAAFQGATNLSGVPAALPVDINGSPQILSTFGMFANCSSFNQDINGWNVESVSSFVNNGTSYSMENMFYGCTSFNRPLNDWDVGNVVIMYGMFDTCTSFNQPLNDWDVKNVTLMAFMFYGCTDFNQPLNNWDVSKVINMYGMFTLSGLRPTNYSNILLTWATLPVLESGVTLSDGPAYNALAVSARSFLTGSKGWIIDDGGLNEALPMILKYTSSGPFTLTLPLDFDFFGPDNIAPNLTIDWGDGFVDTNISISLPTHTFAAAGTYEVKIYADYVRVYGFTEVLQGMEYLTTVVQWGELQTVAFFGAFAGATILTSVPEALPTDIDGNPQILCTYAMFFSCTSFNQNINGWNVESVSSFVNDGSSYSMELMFYGCTSFDKSLNDWKVGNVSNMVAIFYGCTIFNQPLNVWDVKNVTNMSFMFYGCTKFNQPLNDWDVGKVIAMYGMFTLSGLRPTNYSNMLLKWATQTVLESGVTLSVGPAYNASAVSARSTLTGSKGWIIDDGGLNNALPMILKYTSTDPFTLTLPLDFDFFDPDNIAPNLTIDWGDGTIDTNISISLPSHTFAAAGTYEVKIYADYVRVYGNLYSLQGREYLTSVSQWGELQTVAFIGAFNGATSLFSVPEALPTDIDGSPQIVSTMSMFYNCSNFNQDISGWNVSQVEIMEGMFYRCTSFDRPLNAWKVTKVSIMAGMFYGCTDFNQPLNDWDVSLVNNMDVMFRECTKFNQSLNIWKVGNVTGMAGMFYECAIFNQPLNDWDVGNVTRMNAMFYGCTDFNQPLNNWNVGEVTEMSGMFNRCTKFNQQLNNWNVGKVTDMFLMFTDSGLRPTNYSNILLKWAALPLLQSGVTLSDGPAYNALAVSARSFLTGSKGWTILDGGLNAALPMILQFVSTTLPFTISLAIELINFGADNIAPNLTVDWGDGVVTNNAGPHTYTNKKNQQVNIYADYVRNFGSTSTPTGIEYLTEVSQWGLLQTTGFIVGFYNARNLLMVPNQLPMDINGSAQVTSTNSMFLDCNKMNSIFLKTWDVSAVTDMTNMFSGCTAFNQPLKTWDVSAVTLMINVFGGCTAFKQDLSSWNVENVTQLASLFANCTNFQSDLSSWNVENVLYFDSMFYNCKKFTSDLSRWNIASTTSMTGMFAISGMTAEDYSATLIGWAARPQIQANVQLGAQGVYYLSVATKARNFLTAAPYNWTITDNGIAPLPLMPATFTQLQQVVYKFDIDIKTWTPAKTQQVITYSAYIFNVSAKQITATVKAGSVIVTLLIGSPTPPPPPVQPSWKCEYVCPPRVLPKPNAAFNGNTNILTTANTNAFRYSKLVSHRNRNGQSISLPNPLANALFGLNGAPPRNKF